MSAFSKLEALNVAICEAVGAGKGHDTTPAATAAYYAEMRRRRDDVTAAIDAARREVSIMGFRGHYIEGVAAALNRALAAGQTGC